MKFEAPSASRALVGPADLVAAYAHGDVSVAEAIAEQLGLQYHPPDVQTAISPRQPLIDTAAAAVAIEPNAGPDSTGYPDHISPLSIYVPVHYALRSDHGNVAAEGGQSHHQNEIHWRKAPTSGAKFAPLTSWPTLS